MCIDLAKLRQAGRILRLALATLEHQGKWLAPENWAIEETKGNAAAVPTIPKLVARYLDDVIIARFVAGRLDYVQVNFPRLLHGHHGGLIKSETEMALAFCLLRERLNEISHCDNDEFELIYVELGWNFLFPFNDLYRYLHQSRNPFGHAGISGQAGDHCKFRSSTAEVKIYNKTKVMRKHSEAGAEAPEVTRLEVTLKTPRIKAYFKRNTFTGSIPFNTAYDWLRYCVSLIEPKTAGAKLETKQERIAFLCAYTAKKGFVLGDGRSVLEFFNEDVGSKTAKKLTELTQRFTFQTETFSWSRLFPADGIPPPVEFPKRLKKRT